MPKKVRTFSPKRPIIYLAPLLYNLYHPLRDTPPFSSPPAIHKKAETERDGRISLGRGILGLGFTSGSGALAGIRPGDGTPGAAAGGIPALRRVRYGGERGREGPFLLVLRGPGKSREEEASRSLAQWRSVNLSLSLSFLEHCFLWSLVHGNWEKIIYLKFSKRFLHSMIQ